MRQHLNQTIINQASSSNLDLSLEIFPAMSLQKEGKIVII